MIRFHWKYIALPVAVFFLSLILTACFYPVLPSEVAYHFKGGIPDKWLSRGAITAWILVPQFLLTLLAGVMVWGISRFSNRFQPTTSRWVGKLFSIMGNMIALPQIILGFAMLDIFSYNSYQTHLMPLWVFAVIVMGLGGTILGIFFILAIRGVLGTTRGSTR